MSDIRSYSTIAEHADPSQLAGQLNIHRAAMNRAILGEGGTVMQFVGDAVMAVFGAPVRAGRPRRRAVAAAAGMHALQAEINDRWASRGPAAVRARARRCRPVRRPPPCSDRRSDSSTPLVGDTVNLSQRLQQLGVGRRDRALRGHPRGADASTWRRRPAPATAGEGTRYSRGGLQDLDEPWSERASKVLE